MKRLAATVRGSLRSTKKRDARLARGSCETVPARLQRLALPAPLAETVAPLQRVVSQLTTEIVGMDARVAALTAADPVVTRLRSVPGVGLVVATTFRAFVDDVTRFRHAGEVSAAIGVVPRDQFGRAPAPRPYLEGRPTRATQPPGEAAWSCWRSAGSLTLRAWVDRLAARRGKRIAVVALARRLSRILFALWRDGTVFDVAQLAKA
jgi:transposase